MTAIRPPRWMQRLLGAIGADSEFRDDVLGDMADEFAIRAAYDGDREACTWYIREGLRTLPYLVRSWWTCGSRAGFGYIASVVLQAYFAVGLAAGAVLALATAIVAATGADRGSHELPTVGALVRLLGLPGVLVLATACALIGGYVAARIGRRAPFASSIGLGAFWCSIACVALAAMRFAQMPNTMPANWIVSEMFVVMAGTTLGGVWRVASANSEANLELT